MGLVVVAVVAEAKLSKKNAKRSMSSKFRNYNKRATCGINEFQCKDGTCIQNDWICDTEDDCGDMSDEQNCPTDCSGVHQLLCKNQKCITKEFQCDGDDDCGDMTDETDCHKVECPLGEVQRDNFLCGRTLE